MVNAKHISSKGITVDKFTAAGMEAVTKIKHALHLDHGPSHKHCDY